MSEFEHYGRKGMKWYQHIFGEEKGIKRIKNNFKEGSKRRQAMDDIENAHREWTEGVRKGLAQIESNASKVIDAYSRLLTKEEYKKAFPNGINGQDTDLDDSYMVYSSFMKKATPEQKMENIKIESIKLGTAVIEGFGLDDYTVSYMARDLLRKGKRPAEYNFQETVDRFADDYNLNPEQVANVLIESGAYKDLIIEDKKD